MHGNLDLTRSALPVRKYRDNLLRELNKLDEKVLAVIAETGSGKSTQIPAYFFETSTLRVAVTQPRRVAAITLAQRVATEQGVILGKEIGYRVRFDDAISDETRLSYATDGMLLREAMTDPSLAQYAVIFLDECHERSLQTDILIGVLQRARKTRQSTLRPLKLVLMSATMEIQGFQRLFGEQNLTVMRIPGRQFSVQLLYVKHAVEDYCEAALTTVILVHKKEDAGDILVFFPGQEDIEEAAVTLRQMLDDGEETQQFLGDRVEVFTKDQETPIVNGVLICPLYAALPHEVQLKAFVPKPAECSRKIVLATNIAETSVTLPDIRYVVDTGKFKCRQATSTGMESLRVENVSQAQAAQRAGRAGRVQNGICFRLYSEAAFKELAMTSKPEILRVNLSQVVLQLKGMGVDPTTFEFVTPPDGGSIKAAMKVLFALEALNSSMNLTEHGKMLARLPLDPTFGHLLLCSKDYSCTKEMLTAVAMLSAGNIFYLPFSTGVECMQQKKASECHRRFASHEGDLLSLINVYESWKAEAVYRDSSTSRKRKHGIGRIPHNDWCSRNFIAGRNLIQGHNIRTQLSKICRSLGMDTSLSYGNEPENRQSLLKCAAAGLFLQVAVRDKLAMINKGSGYIESRGHYKTKVGSTRVSIHPTSTMFNRNPAPACVVYTELVTTKKTYIRGVSQIREDWLIEVAPHFYAGST